MKVMVINDLHLGVQRTGGTTPASAAELSQYALKQYRRLLEHCTKIMKSEGVIIVNGDLTDKFDIPLHDALEIYEVTLTHMRENPRIRHVWALGNHDLSKDSSKLGTVQFLGGLLKAEGLLLVSEPTRIGDTYIIPHLVNQEEFDAALQQVPGDAKHLLLHCNYDNNFAAQADHSLNLSREQAVRLTKLGIRVILGHEHQGRTAFADKLIVVGNQFPTSVADCLSKGNAQEDGKKYLLELDGDEVDWHTTWSADQEFSQVDWKDLDKVPEHFKFIRVTGQASAEQASEVVRAVAELRKEHDAFVITNAVQVGEQNDGDAVQASIEELDNLSVMKLLKDVLTEEQWAEVEKLMQDFAEVSDEL